MDLIFWLSVFWMDLFIFFLLPFTKPLTAASVILSPFSTASKTFCRSLSVTPLLPIRASDLGVSEARRLSSISEPPSQLVYALTRSTANLSEQLIAPDLRKALQFPGLMLLFISERFAIDLVSAYTNWLGGSDIEDNLLASLTPRSLALMGSKGVTDKERQKVFEAVENGERMTEATVRGLVKGYKKKANKSDQKTESQKIKSLKEKIETYKKVISNLQDENKKLSKLLSNREKIDSLV